MNPDSIILKNSALSKLVGRHVAVGWGRESKWLAGVLHLVVEIPSGPCLWRLAVCRDNRIKGYKPITEVYFTTDDVVWWAPAELKEDKDGTLGTQAE